MIDDKKVFFPWFTPRNIYCGCLLESPHWGDSNKYPQHMFLGVLNTIFLNIFNYLPHLELRNRSIQIVVIVNSVIESNVGIKRFDCILNHIPYFADVMNEYIISSWYESIKFSIENVFLFQCTPKSFSTIASTIAVTRWLSQSVSITSVLVLFLISFCPMVSPFMYIP